MARYALLIATGSYSDQGLQRLRSPVGDARRLAEVLQDNRAGGFDDVTVLEDRPRPLVEEAIEELFADRRSDDLVLLYVSGHGMRDPRGQLYLATPETRQARLASSAVSSAFVHDRVEQSRAGARVVLLDCCYSGAFVSGFRPKADRVDAGAGQVAGRGYVVITASNALEYAFEGDGSLAWDDGARSLFTEAVIAGLTDPRADLDRDGWISTADLYDHVFSVVRERGAWQTPKQYADGVHGHILLARVPATSQAAGAPAGVDRTVPSADRPAESSAASPALGGPRSQRHTPRTRRPSGRWLFHTRTRMLLTVILVTILALAGNAIRLGAQPRSPTPTSNPNSQTSTPPGAPIPKGEKAWSFTTGNEVLSSPTVAGGMVYIGSNDHRVYALDVRTGAKRWSITTGDMVFVPPAVANGTVFVGSYDRRMYALDARTGAKRWTFTTGGPIDTWPLVANGTVYTASQDRRLYALDARTGEKKWTFATQRGGYAVAVVDDVLYVGSVEGILYALDARTGTKRWSFSIPESTAAEVVANGMVYVTGLKGAYAFDARSGVKRWGFAVKDGAQGLIADDSTVYFGSVDHRVYALDAGTGAKRWSFATGNAVSSVPTLAEGVLYVGSGDHNLYALDAGTGVEQWSFATGGNVSSAPAVADGMVYVGSADHRVYAIR